MLEHVAEADQHGQLDLPGLEPVDQQLQVDLLLRLLSGMDADVPGIVDREIALSPVGHLIQFRRIDGRPPASLLLIHLRCPPKLQKEGRTVPSARGTEGRVGQTSSLLGRFCATGSSTPFRYVGARAIVPRSAPTVKSAEMGGDGGYSRGFLGLLFTRPVRRRFTSASLRHG